VTTGRRGSDEGEHERCRRRGATVRMEHWMRPSGR
jgi:hypothetical protein